MSQVWLPTGHGMHHSSGRTAAVGVRRPASSLGFAVRRLHKSVAADLAHSAAIAAPDGLVLALVPDP